MAPKLRERFIGWRTLSKLPNSSSEMTAQTLTTNQLLCVHFNIIIHNYSEVPSSTYVKAYLTYILIILFQRDAEN